jgi:hypothetical protein
MDKDRTVDLPQIDKARFSRRSVLEGAIRVGGAVPVLAITTRRAAAKMSKRDSGYQDSPKGNQHCATCAQFQRRNTCQIVEGVVSPNGWCRIWQQK